MKKQKKTILFIADNATGGGAENQMIDEILILSKYYKVFLLTLEKVNINILNKLSNIEYIAYRTTRYYSIIKKLKKHNFQYIHLHNCWDNSLFVLLRFLVKTIPIVMTVHDYRIVCPTGWKVKYNTLSDCNNSATISNCSSSMCLTRPHSQNTGANYLWWQKKRWFKKYISAWSIVNKDLVIKLKKMKFKQVHLINYPLLNINPFSNKPRSKSFTFAGIIAQHKGIERLIQTIEAILKIDQDIIINIVGNGNMMYDLKQKFDDNENIIFFSYLLLSELYSILSESAVVYLPSLWYENFNLIARYSRIVGTPILIPHKAGFKQRIKNGLSEYYHDNDAENDAMQLYVLINKIVKMKNGSFVDRKDELSTCSEKEFLEQMKALYKDK